DSRAHPPRSGTRRSGVSLARRPLREATRAPCPATAATTPSPRPGAPRPPRTSRTRPEGHWKGFRRSFRQSAHRKSLHNLFFLSHPEGLEGLEGFVRKF